MRFNKNIQGWKDMEIIATFESIKHDCFSACFKIDID